MDWLIRHTPTLERAARGITLMSIAVVLCSCLISYKFNGASIDYSKIHSIAIADFPNNAALVNPMLSSDFSEGVRDIFTRQTRLIVNKRGGDLELEGEIVDYNLTPMAISADSYSAQTKLTMVVRVRFTNNVDIEESFEKTYSAYQIFDSSQMLNDVQDELCATMVKEIAENIYNDTVAKW